MSVETQPNYNFEVGVYRPPSEGGSFSLLLRITRNCPWNRCAFCNMYKTEKFEVRSPDEIKGDIDAIAAICEELKEISHRLGLDGRITRDTAIELINKHPELNYHHGLGMVFNWLQSGAKTAFLQDANSPIMKTERFIEVLQYLRKTFPSLTRVTSYARAKTLAQKKFDELKAIRQAGLDRLHVGLESGDDELLQKIKKGVTAEGHIKGGQKAMEAGFQLSEYWMPGLGGKQMWENHAKNTARVLNAINPHYIRSRPLFPQPGTPIHEWQTNGTFQMLTPNEQLQELRLMVANLDVTSKVCFDHAANYWRNSNGGLMLSHDYEGYQFPDEKPRVLEAIEDGLTAANQVPEYLHL